MARKYQSGTRSGYTVLVIDDSPEILESTRLLLESEGHTVLTAPDGETGLAIHSAERIQLILCDYFMPAMTGEEVVRRVREIEGLLGAENSFLATLPAEPPLEFPGEASEGSEGFVALLEPGRVPSSLEIRYGTGRYDVMRRVKGGGGGRRLRRGT